MLNYLLRLVWLGIVVVLERLIGFECMALVLLALVVYEVGYVKGNTVDV